MIEPSTMLARQTVTFLQSYPATGVEVLEAEFGVPRDVMRRTIDDLIDQGFVLKREFGYYATGYWRPDDDEIMSPAEVAVEA